MAVGRPDIVGRDRLIPCGLPKCGTTLWSSTQLNLHATLRRTITIGPFVRQTRVAGRATMAGKSSDRPQADSRPAIYIGLIAHECAAERPF